MKSGKILKIKGALLDQNQLENYLEKSASEHVLKKRSEKRTYPIHRLEENFNYITKTYELLNRHLKEKIVIHPAGEWLLDNYYSIEETYQTIKKELTLKKYTHFIGMKEGVYEGFARIYVLAAEIVAYSDGKINIQGLKNLLRAYQTKKTLSMEEIWNVGLFINMALIERIRAVCERITYSQFQKYRIESLLERTIEQVDINDQRFKNDIRTQKIKEYDEIETFVEYLSYRLQSYGKQASAYLKILENQVEKAGSNISEMIHKEHFNIAMQKVAIGNCIKSIKEIQRINFTKIFEEINGVENILKKDPAGIYEQMDHTTKNNYRNVIKKIAEKTKISELYITKQVLTLAEKYKEDTNVKKSHVGYYLLGEGKLELEKTLGIISSKKKNKKNIYIGSIIFFTSMFDFLISYTILKEQNNIFLAIIVLFFMYLPISEIVIKIVQYILSKVTKPSIIPKLHFEKDIPQKYTTMVAIPTVLDSAQRTKEMIKKLEVFYLANQSENLYFTLLGDCTSSNKEKESFDEEIIMMGEEEIEKLNQKYSDPKFSKFHFIYRQRRWNDKENCYLGWERKRGLLSQFNSFLLGNKQSDFLFNSMKQKEIPPIQYIITLDADTNLVLDSAKKLVGTMAHILNKPEIKHGKVVSGYGIIQPRIDIDISSTQKSLFTKIFAGNGGVDFYSNAISDIYQDNFEEGIFTGKGIYDLKVFQELLEEAIPENTVLSHDLLEGLYLKCGLATDIVLLDSYPTTYLSYMTRQVRWTRGDWQIIHWLKRKIINKKEQRVDNPLGELDKFKIVDNLRRSLLPVAQIITLTLLLIGLNNPILVYFLLGSIFIDLSIDVINAIICKQEGRKKQRYFSNRITYLKGACLRSIFYFLTLPYHAYIAMKAITKTLYRLYKSKRHLLEWITADEAEKKTRHNIITYYQTMWFNSLLSMLALVAAVVTENRMDIIIAVAWMIAPYICYVVSKKEKINVCPKIENKDKEELKEIAEKTWLFFKEYMTEENHYLPPDNYQASRANKVVDRTSSTNIGLGMVSIISALDLEFINLEMALDLLNNVLETVQMLPKWNGHLYNWYNIKTLKPLNPEYISTVDSGNFVGYLLVLKGFLKEIKDKKQISKEKQKTIDKNVKQIETWIKETDFSKLYEPSVGLLSIGFNIEENKLTPSYYDLLASEARQASLIAIAKRDITSEHWNYLSKSLTCIDRKKGLISWAGTSFEYLMPSVNIKSYPGSLLDESCKFMIMSQKKYCSKLDIPWGISESAFNLKDLNFNYQYKAFGIPWLGLKRGLADELVVASYGSVLALSEDPAAVIENVKRLKKSEMYGKYGLYESIDYTPNRVSKNKRYEVVKTYMAHHQALILLSINNFLNHQILQERFHSNPEIEAVDVLLQEKMPEDMLVVKQKKKVIEKIKYTGYENYSTRVIETMDSRINRLNVISNKDYSICMNQDGTSFSKYKDKLIYRYKETDQGFQGVAFYFKNRNKNQLWHNYVNYTNNSSIITEFSPDRNTTIMKMDPIKTTVQTIIAPNESVEIRSIEIKNKGEREETLEISALLEPVLSTANQDYAHKAFNNLFLNYEEIENGLLIKRKKRGNECDIYLAIGFFTEDKERKLEYEIDKQTLYGRLNNEIPTKIETSEKFSNKVGLVTDPIVAMRRTLLVPAGKTVKLNFIMSVSEDRATAIQQLNQYQNMTEVERAFEISKIRTEEEGRYLGVNNKEIEIYQMMLSYLLKRNPMKKQILTTLSNTVYKKQDLWKYGISGDRPILLVMLKEENDIYTIREILKAYHYFVSKNIIIDLVILDAEENIYEKYLKEEIEREIYHYGLNYLMGQTIYLIDEKQVKDRNLFLFKSNLVINTHQGRLANILKEAEEEYLSTTKEIEDKPTLQKEENFEEYDLKQMNLKYENGYGGFTEDGKEYIISATREVPSVWANVLANDSFGTIVTQNIGGFTWSQNSRLNRISRWSNDTIVDTPSEMILVKDDTEQKAWRFSEKNALTTFGFGYAKYEQKKEGISQKLTTFVPPKDKVKINKFQIKNNENRTKKIRVIYQVDTVLGEDEISTNGNLHLSYHAAENCLMVENLSPQDIAEKVYLYSNEKMISYTGNKDSVHLLDRGPLNQEDSLGNNACAAMEIAIELKSYEEKEIIFVLGVIEDENLVNKNYCTLGQCEKAFDETKRYWQTLLEKLKVRTPVESLNIMLNGWSMYQAISSRLYARSGFHQSGGALGFRDQLQDCVGVMYLKPAMVRKQILKHAAHQFIEGDVEHWWHEETERGIRTRFSDDRLWLVYLVLDYLSFTGDKSILDEEVFYIQGKMLNYQEDENYDVHEPSDQKESIYQHCVRAINVSLGFGEHGLPLIRKRRLE